MAVNHSWKIKPGDVVEGVCPLCKRSLGGMKITLRKVDLETPEGVCRCGRALNKVARRRLQVWMCKRKVAYTLQEAEDMTTQMLSDAKGFLHPYLCPFAGDSPHYHVGAERKPCKV